MVEVNGIASYITDFCKQSNSSSNWIVTLCIFLITVYCLLFFQRRRYKLPPGPIGIPFFGYLPFIGKVQHESLNNLAKKYGSLFSLRIGQNTVIFINEWKYVKDAMGQNATVDKPPEPFDAMPSGLGFASSNGPEWVEQRRFSVKIMKDVGLGKAKWEEMLEEEVDDTIKRIQELKGKPVDALELFGSTFANNIMSLVFGERLPAGHKDTEYVSKMVDLAIHEIKPLVLSNFFPGLCQKLFTLGLYGSKEIINQLVEFDHFVRKSVTKSLQKEGDNEDSYVKKYNEEMKNKIKSGTSTTLTERSLFANAETLILAGSETTRTGMLWLLIAIAEYPEVQAKVHKELDSVLGKDGTVKWADRSTIPYTFACVMEGQRWRTVAPVFLMREVSEDITIGEYKVPKGTYLSVNTWALHNDPKYWKNPEKFDPSRMLLDGGKQINFKPESYNPFSYGKRNCPGEMIALMEILAYFVRIMQNFEVLPESGTKVKHDVIAAITYQPVNFKLRFVPRS